MIKITGYSDDIICVGSDYYNYEWSLIDDNGTFVRFPDGTVIKATFGIGQTESGKDIGWNFTVFSNPQNHDVVIEEVLVEDNLVDYEIILPAASCTTSMVTSSPDGPSAQDLRSFNIEDTWHNLTLEQQTQVFNWIHNFAEISNKVVP